MSADGAFSFSVSEVRACRKPNRQQKNYFGMRELRWSARLGQARSLSSVWSVWFIWSIWLVWFNQINETDRTDQMNKTGWRTFSAAC